MSSGRLTLRARIAASIHPISGRPLSLDRWFGTIDVDFDTSYRTAKALGGSLNDFFVAGAAGGAGAYHRRHGAPVDELRMAMPVSTRTDKLAGGNSFVPTRLLVPTDIAEPRARFDAVRAVLTQTRSTPALVSRFWMTCWSVRRWPMTQPSGSRTMMWAARKASSRSSRPSR